MLIFKYISCIIAILSTSFYISEIITVLKSGAELFLPWKDGAKLTGIEIHTITRRVAAVLMAIFWGIVIVF